METKELNSSEKTKQKIQLVRGEFTPSEAYDVIMSLIDEKINFHKIQRLQQQERKHKCNTDDLDGRIGQLEKEKEIARAFIKTTRSKNVNLKIEGVLEITIAED